MAIGKKKNGGGVRSRDKSDIPLLMHSVSQRIPYITEKWKGAIRPCMHQCREYKKKTNAFSLENLSFNTQRSTLTSTCSYWGLWIYFNHEIHPKQRVKKKQSKIKCNRHKTHMWSSIHRFLLVDNWICVFTLRFSQAGWNKSLL